MSDALPECLACGACCFGQGERYVPVTGDDHARLGELAEEYTQFLGNRCYMRMHQGHCAALCIDAEGRFLCQVYAQRPATCCELARGQGACRAEFEQKRALAVQTRLVVLAPPASAEQPACSNGGRLAP